MGRAINEIGNTYGYLTVIDRANSIISRNGNIRPGAAWLCKCKCGKETVVLGHDLRCGLIKSCGCKRIKDLTNNIFGKLKVINFDSVDINGHALWNCKCVCGRKTLVYSTHLISGETKSCGKCKL